jgi:hypothetical protein
MTDRGLCRMMTLSKESHGYTCLMSGQITEDDIQGYLAQARQMLPTTGSFNLLVDQRDSHVLSDKVQQGMSEVMRLFASRGLARVAVICASTIVAMQMNRLAAGSPVGDQQLALNGKDPNWRAEAVAWLESGIRPMRAA